jgi:hypothetical protein
VNAEELTGAELTMEVTRRAYMLAAEREIDSLRTQLAEAQKNADAFEMEWDKALIGRAQAEASETALKGALMEARADAHFAADHKGAPEDCQDSASCHRWARALSGEGRP